MFHHRVLRRTLLGLHGGSRNVVVVDSHIVLRVQTKVSDVAIHT